VATRFARMVNGIDGLAITNLDGLDSVEEIKICIAYDFDSKRVEVPPTQCQLLARCQPVYINMPGWKSSTEKVARYKDLPLNARRYVEKLCQLTGAKLRILSVGPKRAQTMFL
jgi:adenylosuccinate synthase